VQSLTEWINQRVIIHPHRATSKDMLHHPQWDMLNLDINSLHKSFINRHHHSSRVAMAAAKCVWHVLLECAFVVHWKIVVKHCIYDYLRI